MTNTFITHCEALYKALEERATIQYTESEGNVLVFSGAISVVFRSTGISQSYYGPIFQTLEDVGAILKIQRGAAGVDTVIVLRGLPEVWPEDLGWRGKNSDPLTEDSRYARILVQLQEIEQGNINGISILTALIELEERVVALESKVQRQEKTKGAK